MELLTEPQLGSLALGIAKLAFVAGLAGALTALGILKGVYAVAGFFAERAVKAARIRAARSRSTVAPVEVAPSPLICRSKWGEWPEHLWDADVHGDEVTHASCARCGQDAYP